MKLKTQILIKKVEIALIVIIATCVVITTWAYIERLDNLKQKMDELETQCLMILERE